MEGVAAWLAGFCDELVQVDDGGDATLAEALASKGVRVIGADPTRGLDAAFALATYHPQNVLGVNLNDETVIEVLNCVTVERFFHVPAFDADWPHGWKSRVFEHGVVVERCE
jgi:hypothetical protein